MKRVQWVMVGLFMVASAGVQVDRWTSPDVPVNVSSEVFTSGGQQNSQLCKQCCIFEGQTYSEGAVIKTEGGVTQCQRD